MTPDMLAARRRLFADFEFYAQNSLAIRTKEGAIALLKLKPAQRRLLAEIDRQLSTRGYVRIVILKGRQMGLSTFVGGWMYWWVSQRQAQKALVVTHEAKATKTLFAMTKRFHEKMPDILKPHTAYSNAQELVFDILDSAYSLATAGSESVGRSETITVAHLSEVAFWDKRIAQTNFSGLMDTVPTVPGTAVFIESTANGVSGVFYEQWQNACGFGRDEKGNKIDSDFVPVFLPWFIEDGYSLPVPAGFIKSPAERELMTKYGDEGLTEGHLVFRRMRISEKGEDLFRQEYPNFAEEAFLTSGRPVFNLDRLEEMLRAARDPIARKTLLPAGRKGKLDAWEWEDHHNGELQCFLPFDEAETYYIGADVGGGVKKDFSVAQVLDSKRRQAAVWRSDRKDADFFGTVLAYLGRFFNDAYIICERNNHGILTNRVLSKDEEYANVYTELVVDKVSDAETQQIGFFTSEKSKPFIIGKLRANIRNRELEIYDRDTIKELRTYVITESGKMAADGTEHDDCVISLALADHVNEGSYEPTINQDSWYAVVE